MFGKKEKSKRQTRPAGSLAQYGIFDVPENLDEIGNDIMDDDGDFEAELAALTTDDDSGIIPKRKAARKPVVKQDLDAMVAETMKDINLEEEVSDGEDDPELLSELNMITGNESPDDVSPEEKGSTEQPNAQKDDVAVNGTIKLLQERLRLYQIAEEKAKRKNEQSKARRYNRGIRTLKELLRKAEAGNPVNENDIPPELPSNATAETPEKVSESTQPETSEPESTQPETSEPESTPPENTPPENEPESIEEVTPVDADSVPPLENNSSEEPVATKAIDEEALKLLKSRQQEYKVAAIAWKRAGNINEALQCVQIAKQFDTVISAVNAGETLDLSDMPSSPNTPGSNVTTEKPETVENETQGQSAASTTSAEVKPVSPENLGAALKERLEVCRRIKTTAESEGNSSKARRYGRICKQFEDAIKLHARGKPIPLDELPTPPGFEPLVVSVPSNEPAPEVKQPETVPQSSPESEAPENKRPRAPPIPPPRPQTGKKPNQKTSLAERQLALLQQRQHELKQAALDAKKEGDIELARTYLRQAKGMDPLIDASSGGLPVDMNSIPLSPKAKSELSAENLGLPDDFTVVQKEDCSEEATGTDEEIYENLEIQLTKQIKSCLCTRDYCKALGDVPGYNKWERLALNYKRDLDMLRVRKRDSLPTPLHHYEVKTYSIVQSCTDLSDSDVEISIIRGINYPKDVDTYVMFEFPYPSDNPPADRTGTVKGTCNPEYEAVFSFTGIDRMSRQCQRAFKRHAMKCQVWSKGGFFRSDTLLGTVTVKLNPLETKCVLHDSFPLMDGRKATGGKLELKIRLRNPILTKQIENITDKWLIIDN